MAMVQHPETDGEYLSLEMLNQGAHGTGVATQTTSYQPCFIH
jgi:hypothetical protein